MFTNRLTRTIAVAVAIAAAAAPAAVARPIDGPAGYSLPPGFETADTRDSPAATRGIYEPVPAEPKQDLRSADTRDYADGRGTYNAPEVVVVKAPQEPAVEPTSGGGIDWADVGLGAGSLLGLGLIALAGGALILQRRGAKQLA